jgi:two-component system sensor histidine kinase TorS
MHKPIVALTASVMNEEVEQLKDAGFNGVIPKPIDMDGFPDLIEAILDGKDVWRVIKN